MENEKDDRSAVEMVIERGIKCVTEQHIAAVSLQTPGPDSVLAPEGKRVGSRQRRLRAFIHAAEQILAAEMQAQFPELKGKAIFYTGWRPGSEKSETEDIIDALQREYDTAQRNKPVADAGWVGHHRKSA